MTDTSKGREPTTEAGRTYLSAHRADEHSPGNQNGACWCRDSILEIEAEARVSLQAQVAQLRAALGRLELDMEGAIDSDGCCHFCGALIDPTRAPYSKEAVSAERERLRTAYLASLHGVDDIASRAVLALLSEDSK